jgi:hypothetical protein
MGWLQRRRERIFDERAAQAARTKGVVAIEDPTPQELADKASEVVGLAAQRIVDIEMEFRTEVAAHQVTRWKLRQAEARIDEQDRRIFTLLADLSAARAQREGP